MEECITIGSLIKVFISTILFMSGVMLILYVAIERIIKIKQNK